LAKEQAHGKVELLGVVTIFSRVKHHKTASEEWRESVSLTN
jgi:hypothetical protein